MDCCCVPDEGQKELDFREVVATIGLNTVELFEPSVPDNSVSSAPRRPDSSSLSSTANMEPSGATAHSNDERRSRDGLPEGTGVSSIAVTTNASVGSLSTTSKGNGRRRHLKSILQSDPGCSDLGEVCKLVSFEGDESVCRGSGVAIILHCQARILANSEGTLATYSMSRVVKKINTFISHNWCVPRHYKFLCLSVHFNFNIAVLATAVACSILSVATALGLLPSLPQKPPIYAIGVYCQILCVPVFVAVLLFGRELMLYFRIAGPVVFLDKTCIHQVDMHIQRQGIEKLGAFLTHSDYMFVIYTDLYLQKLWTVYEVASFLAVQSQDRMVVMPPIIPIYVCAGLFGAFVANVLDVVVQDYFRIPYLTQVLLAPAFYILMFVLRHWEREKIALKSRLANFTVDACACFSENDRPILYRNIAKLMIATGIADFGAPERQALQAFDNLVREVLPDVMTNTMGFTVPYKYIVILSALFTMSPLLDEFFAGVAHGVPLKCLSMAALGNSVWTFLYAPLGQAILETVSPCFLHLNGWAERLLLGSGPILAAVFFNLMRQFSLDLIEWSCVSDTGIVVHVLFVLVLSLVTCAHYRGWIRAGFTRFCAAPHRADELDGTASIEDRTQPVTWSSL